MIKLGQATASTQQFSNTVDGLISNMKKDGVATAGRTFMNQGTFQPKPVTKSYGTMTLQDIKNNMALPENNKSLVQRTAGFVGSLAVNTGRALGTIFNPVPAIKNVIGLEKSYGQAVDSVYFRVTHGGVARDEYYRKQYENTINNVNKQYHDLQNSPLNGEAYQKALDELNSWSGNAIDNALQTYKNANLRENGYLDWQTGQYKATSSPSDIFNIIDGAITTGTVFSGGTFKPELMQNAKNGIFASGNDFITNNVRKVIGDKAANTIDSIVTKTIDKTPFLREYADRQIAKLGGDVTAKRFVTSAFAEVAINSPLREMNMEMAQNIVETTMNGKFFQTPEGQHWINSGAGNALLLGGMMLEGGPVGFLYKYGKKFSKASSVLTFGDNSIVSLERVMKAVTAEDKAFLEQYANGAKATSLDHFFNIFKGANEDVLTGYKWLAEHPEEMSKFKSIYASLFTNPEVMTTAARGLMEKLVASGKEVSIVNALDDMFRWQKNGQILNDALPELIKKGVIQRGERAVVVSITREAQKALKEDVIKIIKDVSRQAKELGDVPRDVIFQAQKDTIKNFINEQQKAGVTWAQHDGFVGQLINGIDNAERAFSGKKKLGNSLVNVFKEKETAVAVKGVPKKLANALAKDGYYVALPKRVTNPFIGVNEAANIKIETILLSKPTAEEMATIEGFSKPQNVEQISAILGEDVAIVRGADPVFGIVGALLNKVGIGLQDTSKEAYRIITTNMAESIDNLSLKIGGAEAIKKLQRYADQSRTITDLRMMTKNEIVKALELGGDTFGNLKAAKEIQKAIINAHLTVPLEIRGFGNKAFDLADKYIPFHLQPLYRRIQGAARYTYNPFFQTQERIETKLLSIGETNGGNAYAATWARLNPQKGKYLDDIADQMRQHGVLEATQYGEAATNNVVGRVSARIGKMAQRDLATVVDSMAGKMKMSVPDLLATHTNEVIDAIRPIVQYPRTGFLNSSFAQTMNFVAFPSRYNLKVAKLTLDILGKQTPAVQVAVTKGLMNFGNWINSDEGLAWRQDYAKEIAFIKWLTPLGNLDWTFRTLQGKNTSWSDVGMLGGLPLGAFTQILHDQGVIDNQSPYVDQKTGEIYARRIPASVKGRLASALMDMLGSTFTYPGRTLQLPGKTSALRDVAYRITGSSGKDFVSKQPDMNKMTAEQKKAQAFWKQRYDTMMQGPQNVSNSVAPELLPFLPPLPQKSTGLPHSKTEIANAKAASKSGKRKKAPVPFSQIVGR